MWKNTVGRQDEQRSRKIKLTAALRSEGIPSLRGIKKSLHKLSPQNLSFSLICNEYVILHWGKFWIALCWKKKKKKKNRFSWHVTRLEEALTGVPIIVSFCLTPCILTPGILPCPWTSTSFPPQGFPTFCFQKKNKSLTQIQPLVIHS